jgi:hypothetical protein
MTAESRKTWIGFACAATLLAVALAWTARTARATRDLARRLETRGSDLAEIRSLERRLQLSDARLAELRRTGPQSLVSPAELFTRMTPEVPAPSAEERGSAGSGPGWRARRVDLEFPDLPLPAFGAWLAACENLRPSWRATRIRIEPGSGAGRGRVALSLEGIETEAP